jgi:putative transposase
VKYEYIEAHAGMIGAKRLCHMLGVARSGYYDWKTRGESERSKHDRELLAQIEGVHRASREAYGAVKTWHELNMRGVSCGKHRVARLRKQAGIEARRKRRFRVIVENHHTEPAAPNLVQRQFDVAYPDQVWVGDGTFIRTRQGFLHLAVLLDLHSRRVVGWGMGDRPNLLPVMSALDMALLQRQPARGVIHHTDQGTLYAARAYRNKLIMHGLRPSMSRRGNCYDNAVAESFFSTLKNELVHYCDFHTRDEARAAIFEYIEIFYNRQRRHQTLGYLSPVQFEQQTDVPN